MIFTQISAQSTSELHININSMQWCRRRGCKRTYKSFDLSKSWAKSLKIWAKSLKIWLKSLKIWAKSFKIRAKMAPNVVLLPKMALNVCRKTQLRPIWRSHQKQVFMFFVGENLWAKGQKLFGKIWRNSGKNPAHPQNFACSYTYGSV